jgi:large subunit ribosomal protein L25
MAEEFNLTLEPRTVLGKGLNKLRADGLVPAVIHDHGKDSVTVTVPYTTMLKTYRQAGKHHPLSLKVGSKNYMAMIKDVDFEPRKQLLRHVVFNAIKRNEKVEAEIPVVFQEDAEIPAERASLMVLRQLDHVMVAALPHALPDELTVDPSTLAEIGDRLTVADITAPEGVEILTEPETQVAIVEMPKDQIAEADAAKAELEATTGEGEAAGVESEHGGDTDQEAQAGEDKPGGQEQNQPKGE